MIKEAGNYIKDAAYYFLAVFIGCVLFLNIFFSYKNYTCKKTFLFPNIVLLLFTVFILGFCFKFYRKYGKLLNVNILLLSVFHFTAQIYVFYNIYFVSNQWDSWQIIWNARMIAEKSAEGLANDYFSYYPNNQFIVYIFSKLFTLNNLLGVLDTDNGLMFIISIQCVFSTITGYLLFKIIQDYLNSDGMAFLGWSLYVILVGFSGWNVITYSDGMALVFPIAVLRIYQLTKNKRYIYLKWFFIGLMSYWGFKMKPTCIIVLFSIIISEIISWIKLLDINRLKSGVKTAVMMGICFVIYSSIFQVMISSTGLVVNDESDIGILHMVMMGMNPVTDGVYYLEDVKYSIGITDKDQRIQAQIRKIKERLSSYNFTGFVKHCAKKSLINFNDGTFAWGYEGGFYDVIYEDKNTMAAPFLKNIFYNDGMYYNILASVEQAVWLLVLFLTFLFSILEKEDKYMVITISLLGIMLFVMIFEARARYLYIFAPIFILAGIIGMQRICQDSGFRNLAKNFQHKVKV